MFEHWFWLFLSIACVVWYMTITVFVAVKGFGDIKSMFSKMAADKEDAPPANPSDG